MTSPESIPAEVPASADSRVIEIVFAHNPDTDGPDTEEIGKRYTLDRKTARQWVNSGRAVYADIPVDEAGRALETLNSRAVLGEIRRAGLPEIENESKTAMIERLRAKQAEEAAADQADDLDALTRDELRDRYPAAAALPATAKKAELVEAARQAQPDSVAAAAEPPTGGGPIVTKAPGAEHSPVKAASETPPATEPRTP